MPKSEKDARVGIYINTDYDLRKKLQGLAVEHNTTTQDILTSAAYFVLSKNRSFKIKKEKGISTQEAAELQGFNWIINLAKTFTKMTRKKAQEKRYRSKTKEVD